MSTTITQIRTRARNTKSALLKDVCSHAIKRAALGGDQDTGFEQSFASLAYAYIQDKAPGLLEYLIGFQLVDRNEDNTKAVGIFGFKIGSQWVYAPVFFMNGDLKGHELLYLKNQDMFVPLKENWVNYLMSKKPSVLGESTPDTLQQMGSMEPNLRSLAIPPHSGKFASDMHAPPALSAWAKSIMPKLAEWITKSPAKLEKLAGVSERLDLRSFLVHDVRLVKAAMKVRNDYPAVADSMDAIYGPSLLRDALLEMRKAAAFQNSVLNTFARNAVPAIVTGRKGILKQAAADKPKGKIEIISDQVTTYNLPDLSEKEREKLRAEGFVIKDQRDGKEVSIAYNTQIEMTMVNPDTTDVYDVLTKPGKFERCLVIHNPHGGRPKKQFCTVIRFDGEKSWQNVHQTEIFVKEQARTKSDVESYDDWFDKLPDKETLQKNGTYVIVTKDGSGTCSFDVNEVLGDDMYEVSWNDYGGRRPYSHDRAYCGPYHISDESDDPVVHTLQFKTRPGIKLKAINGKLYIPTEAKAIKIKDPSKCKKCDKLEENCTCDYFRRDYSHSNDPIQPGNLQDLQMEIFRKTAELQVMCDHHEVIVNKVRMSKLAGLIHLVRDYNLREKQARQIIHEAERSSGRRYRIKHAASFGPMSTGQGIGAPAMPEPGQGSDPAYGGVATQEPMTGFQPVDGMSSSQSDVGAQNAQLPVDPKAMQTAQQGQQSGQKEIFDTTMISSLLKAVRDDSLVDRYLGDLMKALDRLGRILFMFYWHNEDFMERYGKQDMPELEDTLINAYEVLGDLILFLEEKTVKPLGVESNMGEPGLDSASNQ